MLLPQKRVCGIPAIAPRLIPPENDKSHIVGGFEAKPHSWPWQVREPIRGGATAGHGRCVSGFEVVRHDRTGLGRCVS